jgi:predicted acyl esterase
VNGDSSRPLLQSAENPGSGYSREPTVAAIARDMDVMVPMRDGVKICVDVYRPDAPGKFPALLAFAISGVAGATNAEYVPYHICSSKTVLHKVFHDRRHPSHLLLPVIPEEN